MAKKIYKSYEEIDRELEILQLEKEIHAQKAALYFKKSRQNLAPDYLVGESIHAIMPKAQGMMSNIWMIVVSVIVRWFVKRQSD